MCSVEFTIPDLDLFLFSFSKSKNRLRRRLRLRRSTLALIATMEKLRWARERPMLAMVVVLPTPPLPEVMTTM